MPGHSEPNETGPYAYKAEGCSMAKPKTALAATGNAICASNVLDTCNALDADNALDANKGGDALDAAKITAILPPRAQTSQMPLRSKKTSNVASSTHSRYAQPANPEKLSEAQLAQFDSQSAAKSGPSQKQASDRLLRVKSASMKSASMKSAKIT